jgi:hypothetical protein
MTKRFSTLLLGLLPIGLLAQNVGINATGAAPATSAMLHVDAPNKGVLVPRLALTSATTFAPATGTQENSLLIFNTATSATPSNTSVSPGYYYWSTDLAPARWVRVATDRSGWLTEGNWGTTPATHFVGTRDNQALRFRTNNLERFEISTGGHLRAFANGTAAAPVYSWSANTGTGMFQQAANVIGFSTAGVERMRIAANGHVGIGGTPANGAILDVQSTNRGVLLPRVALVAENNANPVGGGNVVDGLLVFNTATAGANPNAVTPGLYRWDAVASRWRRLVEMKQEVWIVGPLNINANTIYTVTATIPGVTAFSGVSIALTGNWGVAPDVTIHQIEARTGQVRFVISNNTGGILGGAVNYLAMEWNVTITRY